MTSKEAYERLDWALHKLADALGVNFPELAEDYDFNDTLEKMQELSIRDTPMKVNSYAGSIFREYKCQCGQHFNSFYHLVEINFCPKCGQRLDWGEE